MATIADKDVITTILKTLQNLTPNKTCFDCSSKYPTWASVTYGIFICIDCSARHRSLGVHLSFVRSIQLDTKWTQTQLKTMELGGNANAEEFFQRQNLTKIEFQQRYNSRGASLYKEKLQKLVAEDIKLNETKLIDILDADQPESTDLEKEDFFEELVIIKPEIQDVNNLGLLESSSINETNKLSVATIQPSFMETVLTKIDNPSNLKLTRKPRKGGLGARRVALNFNDIEEKAENQQKEKERIKEAEKERVKEAQRLLEEKKEQIQKLAAQAKLAHKEIVTEDRLKKVKEVVEKKVEQSDCLGINFTKSNETVNSHSAFPEPKKPQSERQKKLMSTAKPPTQSAPIDIQKHFGDAKSISSSQLREIPKAKVDQLRKTNLQRFESSDAISSSEYFNKKMVWRYRLKTGSEIGEDLENLKDNILELGSAASKAVSGANDYLNNLFTK